MDDIAIRPEQRSDVDHELHKVTHLWLQRAQVSQCAHYDAANFYERLFLTLGCLVVALSAIIGSTEVLLSSETISQLGPDAVKSVSGVISLVVAILAGLQTFLKLSQKSENHRVAGARYGEVRRSLEELDILTAESLSASKEELHNIKQNVDDLALHSPELPNHILRRHGGTDA